MHEYCNCKCLEICYCSAPISCCLHHLIKPLFFQTWRFISPAICLYWRLCQCSCISFAAIKVLDFHIWRTASSFHETCILPSPVLTLEQQLFAIISHLLEFQANGITNSCAWHIISSVWLHTREHCLVMCCFETLCKHLVNLRFMSKSNKIFKLPHETHLPTYLHKMNHS